LYLSKKPHISERFLTSLFYLTAGEGQFLRKGQVGDWTNYFSKEQNARMDAWIERNSAGHDLPLVYHPDAADV